MKLSEKILILRKQAGLSQEELAEKLDVSRQAVSRWESGAALPDAANIIQLSKLFAVTADYLLNDGVDAPPSDPKPAKRHNPRNILAFGISTFGLLGNSVIYLLSRGIEVVIPRKIYGDGGEFLYYEWDSAFTGHSFHYFVETYDLEFLTTLFWALFIAGLLFLILNSDRAKKLLTNFQEKRRKKRSSTASSAHQK